MGGSRPSAAQSRERQTEIRLKTIRRMRLRQAETPAGFQLQQGQQASQVWRSGTSADTPGLTTASHKTQYAVNAGYWPQGLRLASITGKAINSHSDCLQRADQGTSGLLDYFFTIHLTTCHLMLPSVAMLNETSIQHNTRLQHLPQQYLKSVIYSLPPQTNKTLAKSDHKVYHLNTLLMEREHII